MKWTILQTWPVVSPQLTYQQNTLIIIVIIIIIIIIIICPLVFFTQWDLYYLINYIESILQSRPKSEKGFEISAPYTPLADRSKTSLWCSPLLDKRTLLCLINMILSLSICWVQCNSNIHFVSWCSCSFGLEVGLHCLMVQCFLFLWKTCIIPIKI